MQTQQCRPRRRHGRADEDPRGVGRVPALSIYTSQQISAPWQASIEPMMRALRAGGAQKPKSHQAGAITKLGAHFLQCHE